MTHAEAVQIAAKLAAASRFPRGREWIRSLAYLLSTQDIRLAAAADVDAAVDHLCGHMPASEIEYAHIATAVKRRAAYADTPRLEAPSAPAEVRAEEVRRFREFCKRHGLDEVENLFDKTMEGR